MLHIHATAYNELESANPVSGVIPDDGGSIGRGDGNTVVLSDPSRMVSRRHLEFKPDGRGSFSLVNVSTANPVLVNGRELDAGMSCPIGHGDRIQVGNFVVEVGRRASVGVPGALGDPGDQAEIARLTGLTESDPLGLGLAGSRPAEPGPVADDFLSGLLGESSAAPPAASHVAEPVVGADEFDAFVQTPRRGDPIEQLGISGLELRDLGPRGDALINAEDSPAAVAELTRDPLMERPRAVGGEALADPLALFDDGRGGGLDLLAAGIGGVAAEANHGSDLDGLFRLPAVARTGVSAPVLPDDDLALDAAGLDDSWRQMLMGAGERPAPSAAFDPPGSADEGGGPEPAQASPAAPAAGSPADPAEPAGPAGELLVPDFDWMEAIGPVAGAGGEAHPAPHSGGAANHGIDPERAAGFSPAVASAAVASIPAPSGNPGGLGRDREAPRLTGDARPAPAATDPGTAGRASPAPVPEPADGRWERAALSPAAGASAVPAAGAQGGASPEALYRAFLEGLGVDALPDRVGLDPEFMRLTGRILRACAQGTVELMAARAAVKREVKANVTLIAPERNNPLKFSPDGEVALMYLLGRPYPGFMKPVDAVNHAYADLRAHQLGMISGMRSALAHVLERFNPEVIDREALRAGLVDSLLSIGRKARLWDAYGRYFENTRESAEDRFQEFFGSVFVDAYEQAATDSRAAFRARGEGRE